MASKQTTTTHVMNEEERQKDNESLSDDDDDDDDEDNDGYDGETSGPEVGSSMQDGFGRSSAGTAGPEEDSADTVSSLHINSARKKLPGHPNVVQIIQRPRTHVNHTYHDLSEIPNDGTYSLPGDIDLMTFPEKLFHLLSSTSSYAQESIVWRPHGRAFRIKSEEYLQKYGLLKLYFGYARIQRFFKQLLNHDFKEITQGLDKGCFYNEVRIAPFRLAESTDTHLTFLLFVSVLSERYATSPSVFSFCFGTTSAASRSRERT